MPKRLVAATVLLGALLTGSPAAYAETDRLGGYQVQPALDLLMRLGVISGDPGGTLRLGDSITRAELAKIVVVAMGQGPAAEAAKAEAPAFSDVKGHWALGHVAVAKRLGITSGYEDGTFRPGSPVTNAEAITMLLRASGLKPPGTWPQAYLTAARNAGVLTESLQAALPPNNRATRAAVFLLAERAFTRIADMQGATLLQRTFGQGAPRITVTAQGVEAGTTRLSATTLSIAAPGATLVQVNGQPAWQAQTGAFSYRTELRTGRNEFFVIAVNALGNQAQHFFAIERR